MNVIKIGRNPDNDFVFQVPTISGYHADITFHDNGLIIYTDHSKNGTMINGQLLKNCSQMIKFSDDILLPGGTRLDVNGIYRGFQDNGATVIPDERATSGVWPDYSSKEKLQAKEFTFLNFIPYLFSHFADFNGRARRKEYWFAVLWNVIIITVLYSPGVCMLLMDIHEAFLISFILVVAYSLVMFVPFLALYVRRIHDINHHWTYMLFLLIPLANVVFSLIIMFKDSYPGENQWGPYPKRSLYR